MKTKDDLIKIISARDAEIIRLHTIIANDKKEIETAYSRLVEKQGDIATLEHQHDKDQFEIKRLNDVLLNERVYTQELLGILKSIRILAKYKK